MKGAGAAAGGLCMDARPTDEAQPSVETRTVTIPASAEHDGYAALTVTLPWVCLICGGPRGEPGSTISYDGSRRLHVHGWSNPCGHVESYRQVRESLAGKPASITAAMPADDALDFAAALLRMTGPEMRERIKTTLSPKDRVCDGCGGLGSVGEGYAENFERKPCRRAGCEGKGRIPATTETYVRMTGSELADAIMTLLLAEVA